MFHYSQVSGVLYQQIDHFRLMYEIIWNIKEKCQIFYLMYSLKHWKKRFFKEEKKAFDLDGIGN